MTRFVQKHNKIALLESDGEYWIGSYAPWLTHQNGEPLYVWIRGSWDNEAQGLEVLSTMTGWEE